MKKVELQLDEFLYDFYRKLGGQVGKSPERVMADALFRFAGEASLQAIGKKARGR